MKTEKRVRLTSESRNAERESCESDVKERIASELMKLAKGLIGGERTAGEVSKSLLTANGKLGVAIANYDSELRKKNNGIDEKIIHKVLDKVGDAMDALQKADEILEDGGYL